jgi:hypothetical protein
MSDLADRWMVGPEMLETWILKGLVYTVDDYEARAKHTWLYCGVDGSEKVTSCCNCASVDYAFQAAAAPLPERALRRAPASGAPVRGRSSGRESTYRTVQFGDPTAAVGCWALKLLSEDGCGSPTRMNGAQK